MRKIWFVEVIIVVLVLVMGVAVASQQRIHANDALLSPAPTPTSPAPTPEPALSPVRPILRWHRIGGFAGYCDQLSIDVLNQPHYSRCDEGPRFAPLTQEELSAYLVYVARHAPFEYSVQDNSGGPDNLIVSLSFVGRGSHVVSAAEQVELAGWAGALYDRLLREEQREDLTASARTHLARRLGISTDAITTISVESVTWPDACLGVVEESLFCARVLTPGYRLVLDAGDSRYEYHTDLHGLFRPATGL